MLKQSIRTLCIAASLFACAVSSSGADEIAVQGRKILDTHKGAVVTVLLVIKQKISFPGMPSRDSESKVEASGTVIGADGLTVTSLSLVDPTSLLEIMMAGTQQGNDLKMETEIRDAQIMLSDGTEIPAEVILRDKDLDMAFVRPLELAEEPFQFIDLAATGEPDYLDQVITLNRLGRVAGRAYAASIERIDAIVKKPRLFYIPGRAPTSTGLGSPAFTSDGEFIGVVFIRAIKSTGGGGGNSMLGGQSDNITTVILPAIDIADAAEQAPPFKD